MLMHPEATEQGAAPTVNKCVPRRQCSIGNPGECHTRPGHRKACAMRTLLHIARLGPKFSTKTTSCRSTQGARPESTHSCMKVRCKPLEPGADTWSAPNSELLRPLWCGAPVELQDSIIPSAPALRLVCELDDYLCLCKLTLGCPDCNPAFWKFRGTVALGFWCRGVEQHAFIHKILPQFCVVIAILHGRGHWIIIIQLNDPCGFWFVRGHWYRERWWWDTVQDLHECGHDSP